MRQCTLKHKECPLKRQLVSRDICSFEIQVAKATNGQKKGSAEESRITIKSLEWRYLGLLVYYSGKTSRHRQNGLSYVPKKMLLGCLRKLGGGSQSNRR